MLNNVEENDPQNPSGHPKDHKIDDLNPPSSPEPGGEEDLEEEYDDDDDDDDLEYGNYFEGDYDSGDDYGQSYEKYGGYNGYSDDAIDDAFEGDPMNTWNVD